MAGPIPGSAVPIAERAALAAIRADSEDPWARYALGCVHLMLAEIRRFPRRARVGAEPQSELRASAEHVRPRSRLFLAAGRMRMRRRSGAATEPARSVFGYVQRNRRLRSSSSGATTRKRCGWRALSIRLRGDMSGATGCSRISAAMAGKAETSPLPHCRRCCARSPNFSLAWIACQYAVQARCRP